MKFLTSLFSKKNKTFNDLTIEDMEQSRRRLYEEERRISVKLEKKEEEKKTLFKQGVDAASQYQKLSLARRISEVENESKSLNVEAARISQRIRTTNKFIEIKKGTSKNYDDDPVWKILTGMPVTEIEAIMTGEIVEISEQDAKVKRLLEVLEVESPEYTMMDEPPEVRRLLEAFEKAGESSSIEKELNSVTSYLQNEKEYS